MLTSGTRTRFASKLHRRAHTRLVVSCVISCRTDPSWASFPETALAYRYSRFSNKLPPNTASLKNQTQFRVRYAETDQMGIVYHANYLVWMEVGRIELVRGLGLNYHDLEANEGLLLSVIHASCRYIYPARYDQEVCVETELSTATPRMVEFAYRIYSANPARLLAEGVTRHLWLNRSLRPSRLPAHYLRMLNPSLDDDHEPEDETDPPQ